MNTTERHDPDLTIESAIDSALSRVARELADIAKSLDRLESLVALIASAATAK
jgi:hypothetical protein